MRDKDSKEGNSKIEVAEGKVLYNVVRNAFREAGMVFYPNANTAVSNNPSNTQNNNNNNNNSNNNGNNNYHFEIKNDRAILVWFDTIRDLDYFSILKPWQVVNRLPQANVICRKAPFVRIIQRIQPFFPQLYRFLPKSYILPIQKVQFIQAVAKHDRKHIIKPDNGSLGAGITILEKKMSYSPSSYLAIAQEYIESYLINNTKFDLRIFCLISSINPLKVYVYRGGVARFCSQPVDSTDSVFSQLTNTAVNKTNPNIQQIESITQMVNDVFEKLKTKDKVDIDALWKRIDQAITLTVLAAYNYLFEGEEKVCKPCGYSRCFQILGFDVLLDQKLDPIIMEVNYRPSLETDTRDENAMKCDMLSTAMKIAVPLNEVQDFIRSKFINTKLNSNGCDQRNKSFAISESEWSKKVNDEFLFQIQKRLQNSLDENQGKFVQTYPCNYDDNLSKQYSEIIEKVKTFPTSYEERFKLPVEMKSYVSYKDNTTTSNSISNTTKPTSEIIIKKDSTSHLPPISQKLNQPQQSKPPQQIQQNTPQQQAQQNKPTPQTQPNKPTPQAQQTKPTSQTQQNKPAPPTQQTKPTPQTQQNKPAPQAQQTKPTSQTQQTKPTPQTQQTKPTPQTQQTKSTPKIQQNKSQQTQQNSNSITNNTKVINKKNQNSINVKYSFDIKEPSSTPSTTSKRISNSKRDVVNPSLASHSDKYQRVTRPNSNKTVYISSTQPMSKTMNSNASRTPTTRDSISSVKSTSTIKSFSTTNTKIGNNKDRIRASGSLNRTNIRASSNKKPNIEKKTDSIKLAKPQISKA